MGSTRLPGKIMKELAGHPMLWHVVRRAQNAKKADLVVVATTTEREDDVVERFCQENNFPYYRGSADNVLSRYFETAKKYGARVVIRVTADCPLVDPVVIDQCIEEYFRSACDYISIGAPPEGRTYPLGLDVEVFSFEALERAFKEAQEPYEKEHVTPYIWENKSGVFHVCSKLKAPPEHERDYRLTVDYPEDFMLMEEIYKALYTNDKTIIPAREVMRFLDLHPEIVGLNAHCVQKAVR